MATPAATTGIASSSCHVSRDVIAAIGDLPDVFNVVVSALLLAMRHTSCGLLAADGLRMPIRILPEQALPKRYGR